jgi:hypothetical protein
MNFANKFQEVFNMTNYDENKDVMATPWEDARSINESYSSDSDLDLYCDYLGKMRQTVWNVI